MILIIDADQLLKFYHKHKHIVISEEGIIKEEKNPLTTQLLTPKLTSYFVLNVIYLKMSSIQLGLWEILNVELANIRPKKLESRNPRRYKIEMITIYINKIKSQFNYLQLDI